MESREIRGTLVDLFRARVTGGERISESCERSYVVAVFLCAFSRVHGRRGSRSRSRSGDARQIGLRRAFDRIRKGLVISAICKRKANVYLVARGESTTSGAGFFFPENGSILKLVAVRICRHARRRSVAVSCFRKRMWHCKTT